MNYYPQFNKFDPRSDDVPSHPFASLPVIAGRARVMLRSFNAEQFDAAAERISCEIDRYYSELKKGAISRLQSKLEGDNKAFEKFFKWEGKTKKNGRWLFKDEMVDELGIPTAENNSEVNALKALIDKRDYHGHTLSTLPESKEYPEGNDYQLFAVLSLWLIADTLKFLNKKQVDLSVAGEYALKAMDAVCHSEHLYEAAWLVSFTKNRSNEEATAALLKEKSENQEFLTNYNERKRKEKSDHAKAMNVLRHKETYKAKNMVIEEWGKLESTGISPPQAGNRLSEWLESQCLNYEPSTITNWIRAHRKQKTVK